MISKVSVKECAKLCVSEDSFSCTSFDYCGETMKCSLSANIATEEFPVEENGSFACDVYNSKSRHVRNNYLCETEQCQDVRRATRRHLTTRVARGILGYSPGLPKYSQLLISQSLCSS